MNDKELRKEVNKVCKVCYIPIYLWKKGDDETCYSCRQLFLMEHDEVMRGDYQTRFTSGIHRQALSFAYFQCLEEREQKDKEIAALKSRWEELIATLKRCDLNCTDCHVCESHVDAFCDLHEILLQELEKEAVK